MKSQYREILADIRAAIMLSHPDALYLALDGMRELPEIAGNQKLSNTVQNQLVLPAGKLLSNQNVLTVYLQNLASDRLTGLRAVAASALLLKYLSGDDDAKTYLYILASGRRDSIRHTLSLTAHQSFKSNPERLIYLAELWLAESGAPKISPEIASRLKCTALFFLRATSELSPKRSLLTVAPFSTVDSPEVNAALVKLLSALAQASIPQEVLDLLGQWTEESPPNDWVICKVLSERWVSAYPEEAFLVLDKLEMKTGKTRLISHARKSLNTKIVH